jgi:hypothetical protein
MDKSNLLIIALLALIFIGFLHSRVYQPTTTTKTVVVKEDPYYRRYGYPPPPHYNRYKAQYYN